MAKVDHHVHTSRHSPDSVIAPLELIERARAAGLDAVVITEHDHQWSAAELAEMNARSNGLVVLSGAEISAREGHFLVYGLPNLDEVEPGVSLGALLAVVRKHKAAIVAAHPFRWEQDFPSLIAQHGPVFDGVELVSNNVTPETRKLTERALQATPMAATGSSDGHVPAAVGCYYTEFPGPIRTMADFVLALQRGESRPRHNPGAWQAAGPVD